MKYLIHQAMVLEYQHFTPCDWWKKVDLIITDLHMPDMDGIEFVREVRLSEKIDLIPVLMITSDYNTDKMLEAYDAGVDEFMQKPFTAVDLEEKIKVLFNH